MNTTEPACMPTPQQSRKRPFSQISGHSPNRTSSNWIPNFPPTIPPLRFEGDGLDYRQPVTSRTSLDVIDTTLPPLRFVDDALYHRRPAMSQARPNFIDLTEEPDSPPQRRETSPPDYELVQDNDEVSIPSTSLSSGTSTPQMQEVIEVEDNSSPAPRGRENGNLSPEVEILHSRPTNGAQGAGARRPWTRVRGQGVEPYLGELRAPAAEPATRYRDGPMVFLQHMFASVRGRDEQQQDPYAPRTHNGRNFPFTGRPDWMPLDLEGFDHATPSVRLPGNLDFHVQGFQMEAVNRVPPLPIYKAPPSPRPGFTRSPDEDQMIVCPNCDQELAEGESDIQRQVWVSKTCGHVYCGRCAQNRHKSKTKRGGKQQSSLKTFKKCVVEGCEKQLSNPRNMFQIYL